MSGELLSVCATAAFFVWWGWGSVTAWRRARRFPVPDRQDKHYTVFSNAFDRVIAGSDVPRTLITSGVRCEISSATTVTHLEDRLALAEAAFIHANQDHLYRDLEQILEINGSELTVCILIDQSGSMTNRLPIISGKLRSLSSIMTKKGVNHAILGFTTLGWHGGALREAWAKAGSPAYAGRVCSLLHIVYKDFDRGLDLENLKTLSRADVCFENVDGEALIWASEKLRGTKSSRRLLLILSDGAPVDDLTLTVNGPSYLERHLLDVISDIEVNNEIELKAIGIDFDVGRYYSNSVMMNETDDFVEAFTKVLN